MKIFIEIIIIVLICPVSLYSQVEMTINNNDSTDSLKLIQSEKETKIYWGDKEISLNGDTTVKEKPELTLSLGFNFDFLSGVKVNDLYADVNADIPFMLLTKKVTKRPDKLVHRIGIEVGAYQIKSVSTSNDTINRQFRLVNPILNVDSITGLQYITANTKSSTTISRENFGVYFQPKLNLRYDSNGDYESMVNLIGHFEWYKSDINLGFDFDEVTSIDTALSVPLSWPRPFQTVSRIPENENRVFQQNYINAGIGFDINITRPSGSLQFKPIVGVNRFTVNENINDALLGTSISNLVETQTRWFYIVQAEFLEQRILGLKLFVEVRGFTNTSLRRRVEDLPQFSVSLSKQFSLDKIAEIFSKN